MKSLLLKFAFYHLPPWILAITIFIASSIPSSSLPEFILFGPDKLLHAGVFFAFAVLTFRSIRRAQRPPALSRRPFLATFWLTAIYAVFDELHQHFVPGRMVDPFDVVADLIGISIALVGIWVIFRFGWLGESRTG